MKKLPGERMSASPGYESSRGHGLPIRKPRQLIQRPELIRNLGNSSRQDQLVEREEEDADAETDKDERETETSERDRDLVYRWRGLCFGGGGLALGEFMDACE